MEAVGKHAIAEAKAHGFVCFTHPAETSQTDQTKAIDGTTTGRSRAVPSRGERGSLAATIGSDQRLLSLGVPLFVSAAGGPELVVDLLDDVAARLQAHGEARVDEPAFHLRLAVEDLEPLLQVGDRLLGAGQGAVVEVELVGRLGRLDHLEMGLDPGQLGQEQLLLRGHLGQLLPRGDDRLLPGLEGRLLLLQDLGDVADSGRAGGRARP